ncbi:phosphoribosylamine--glycine ligase [Nitrosomonas sp. Nm51]|uniref:phosphoribosylamine--glycine ligase n=1 Tax=Nitrosomonas sp. Nm51 TaxID=133720 RepID=UPI0008AF625F|nr:phosphoribosylamine--glycine ligase [Nitrosomonas sp. Nm51]SER69443.1 phosphoribosylamine--glycine ligase [Nitrosomonas sp. Nm51]
MKLLVIGSGGREHALAWKLIQSPRVEKVFVAPGNAGMTYEYGVENIAISTIPALVYFAQSHKIAFTIVGPELSLADGIVDAFLDAGLKIFGPSRKAARLETSKSFAKNFMQRHNIPTAVYDTFTDAHAAHQYIEQRGAPIVIKAAGLAAGKGVIVAPSLEKAHNAVDQILVTRLFGEAGAEVIIEEFLQGIEVSFIVMCDGQHVLPLATSQDHKRLHDGNTGPNTGGMGAYSPTPFISPGLHAQILREVIYPAVQGMAQEGVPYIGFLYAGLMITPDNQIKVLEFNCRMGDPETQPILMRLKSDLSALIEQALNGALDQTETDWDRRVALSVVMAAGGYPDNPQKGDAITGLTDLMTRQNATDDFHIFHSGTALNSNDQRQFVTAGGRVLCVTALGDNLKLAQQHAYTLAKQIHYNNSYMRHDIGHTGIEFIHKP